jgi:hypothetical protein
MSDRFALVFLSLIVGLFALDAVLNEATVLIFLGQKLMDVIEWLAFWR